MSGAWRSNGPVKVLPAKPSTIVAVGNLSPFGDILPAIERKAQPPPPPPSEMEWPPEEETEGTNTPAAPVVPHNREAEEATIGSVLINSGCFTSLQSILKAQDFYIDRHKWIWQAFEGLTEKSLPLDMLTVPEELQRSGRLEDLGGESYLTALLNQPPTSLHAEAYARLVKEQADRRATLKCANELATLAYNPKITPEQIASRLAEMAQAATGNAQVRYVVRDAAYALEPRPPVEWIVKDLIYKKSVTVMYGDGGTKKTWSAMHLAACVSSGAPWGDFETKKCRVLFIDEENGDAEIAERAGNCIRGALADENADLRFISLAAFHLDDPSDEARLTTEILKQSAELVVMDALADLMIGDENSKQDTQPVFNALRRIAEKTGAAILVIHHANKNGGHRGSSVIKDAPDILLQVSSDPESNFINFKTEKNRKGKSLKWSMRATWSEDSFYLTTTETQEKAKVLSKSQDYVIRYLTELGASDLPTIMGAAAECSENAARQAVYALASMGKVYRTNPGGKPAIYDLSKQSIYPP